jgi:hypothetical protein
MSPLQKCADIVLKTDDMHIASAVNAKAVQITQPMNILSSLEIKIIPGCHTDHITTDVD